MTRHARRRRRRPPQDPFDVWLQLLAALIVDPLIELGRRIGKLFRREEP